MATTNMAVGSVRSEDGTTIAFERSGHGAALILVDAAGCYRDFGSLRPLAELLAAAGCTVFTYDRRGRGSSGDTAPYAIEREVDDLAALVAEAGGSALVYGNSSGGLLALHAAAGGVSIPKLVLFEPPIGGPVGDTGFTQELAALVAEPGQHGRAHRLGILGRRGTAHRHAPEPPR